MLLWTKWEHGPEGEWLQVDRQKVGRRLCPRPEWWTSFGSDAFSIVWLRALWLWQFILIDDLNHWSLAGSLTLCRRKRTGGGELRCWMRGSQEYGMVTQQEGGSQRHRCRPTAPMGKTSCGLSWGLDAGTMMWNWSFPRRFVVFYNQSCYLDYRHPPQGLRGVNSESACWPFFLYTHPHPPFYWSVQACSIYCSIYCHSPTGPLITHQSFNYLSTQSSFTHPSTYHSPSISPSHQPTHPCIFPPTNLPTCSSTHPPRYSTQHMFALS